MENALHGTWKLNIDKSVAEPGPLVQREVRAYEAAGADGLKLFVQGIDAAGAAYSYSERGGLYRRDGLSIDRERHPQWRRLHFVEPHRFAHL